MEQDSSIVSPYFFQVFSGIAAISSGFRPLLTLPLFSPSSKSYSYVIESTFGRVGSASFLLSSMALWRRRSSSAAGPDPSMLFIITCIMISRSRFRASNAYLYIYLWIWWIVSLVSSLFPGSSPPLLCLLPCPSFLFLSFT